MKKIALLSISFYQKIVSPLLHQITGTKNVCRFDVTCSQYAKESVERFGLIRGFYLSTIRILKCQPFYNKAI